MRYFRSAVPTYGELCEQLDAAYGYPKPETKTLRTLPAVDELPSDADGRIYLAVPDEYCEYQLPKQALTALLGQGLAEEITEEQYSIALLSDSQP